MAAPRKSRPSDIPDRLVDAALAAAGERGWLALSMAEIAEAAGVSVADAFAAFPSKAAVLEAFFERVDRQVLADAAPDLDESVRDRLFEVVMMRFDALAPHKPAVAAFVRELPADPLGALLELPRYGARVAQMLECAGVSSTGPLGAVRVHGLALIYLDALRVWLEDDSPDMARTMAALDRGLRRAESAMRTASAVLPPPLRPDGPPPAEEPGEPDDEDVVIEPDPNRD